jgi:hypothetical protein
LPQTWRFTIGDSSQILHQEESKMAIMSALMLKVRPGKEKDLLELLKTVKKIV